MPNRDGNTVAENEVVQETVNESSTTQEYEIIHIRKVVAGNPRTPAKVLARLAKDPIVAIRQKVAENKVTPVETLLELSADSHPDIRLAVAENLNTPLSILAKLAEDENVDVRYGVAENSRMPRNILSKLGEDENPYVRCRAMKTLETIAPSETQRLQMLFDPGYGTSFGLNA